MTVKVSKPAINVREELADLRKPTGIAGEAMLRAETPQEQFNLIGAGRRNLIINGSCIVAQRPNRSPSGFTGSFYAGPDRWAVNRSGTGSTGFSQIASTDFGGIRAAQATFLSANGETFIVTQRIEVANIAHLAGQPVTLSFWVSGSNDVGSATLDASLSYAGAPDNFTSETVIGSPQSIAFTGTAQRVTFTVTLPSGAANGVAVRIAGTHVGATGTFTLTFGGVQLEAGKTATPFEHRSYVDELQSCQRYYEHSYPGSSTPPVNGANTTSYGAGATSLATVVLWHNASDQGRGRIDFKVVKRAQATLTRIGNSQGYLGYIATGGSAPTQSNNITFSPNLSLSAAGTWGALISNQVTGSPVWGVGGGWIADAEL